MNLSIQLRIKEPIYVWGMTKQNHATITEIVDKMHLASNQTRTRMKESLVPRRHIHHLLEEDSLIFIQTASSLSGFPTPKDGCPGDAVNSEGESSHTQIAIVGSAHLLHIFEPLGHVRPQLIVYFLLVPHETLNILQVTKPHQILLICKCVVTHCWFCKSQHSLQP